MREQMKDEDYLSEFKLKEKNIIKLAVKIERCIDLIASPNIIFDEKYIYELERIRRMIEELKKEYDLILIDTSNDLKYVELTNMLVSLSDKVICLTQGNLIHIKKTMSLLNEHIDNKEKISIIDNKKNQYTMGKRMLELIFFKYEVSREFKL